MPYMDIEGFNSATERFLQKNVFAKKMGYNLRRKAMDMLDPEKLNIHEISEYEKLKKRYYK